MLIKFDKSFVVKWLFENGIIDNNLSNLSEEELSKWFLNNMSISEIRPYNKSFGGKVLENVYKLLHSISHLAIRAAAELSGLDQTSISEYIFPSVPSVFIYSSSSTGTVLGSFMSLYNYKLLEMLEMMKDMANNCLFDPVCINEEKACLGCLHIPDVSCKDFNMNLDRSLVVGIHNHNENTKGYWE